jgi:hypothetical protein
MAEVGRETDSLATGSAPAGARFVEPTHFHAGPSFVPAALPRLGAAAPLFFQLQRTAGNHAASTLVDPQPSRITGMPADMTLPPAEMPLGEELAGRVEELRLILARSVRDRAAVRTATERALSRAEAALEPGEEQIADVDAQSAEQLQQGPSAGSGGSGPTFDHSGGQTVTIHADSAAEFVANAAATIGSPHTGIVLTPDVVTDERGKVISIDLTVKTSIVKVRFGIGRVNDKNRQAINQIVTMIMDHESAHRAIIESEAKGALEKARKKFVGKRKGKQAEKALTDDLECAANKKHEALDAKEGLIIVTEQQDGSITLTRAASGAKYPCP